MNRIRLIVKNGTDVSKLNEIIRTANISSQNAEEIQSIKDCRTFLIHPYAPQVNIMDVIVKLEPKLPFKYVSIAVVNE